MNESQVFIDALKMANPAEREAFLDAVCTGNPDARAAIAALLRVQANNPDFLEQPADLLAGTQDAAPDMPCTTARDEERPGTVLAGRYKLLEEIGAGGMGTVWMAQQTEPIKRLVAVKLIKAGMDSKSVVARFEAERHALALMDHPHIAKVHDAGTTETGRPFFVMELVKGIPLTKYCDNHHLTPQQRLELFVPVCQAVQHAHQKGIIHRDLKPGNLLVALYDGKPVPKVIDFGVAKAAGPPLTEHTLVTGFGTVVGTLEYMSPEQAELNQIDIDTRSDIYSLGVVLYELLTGSTPLDRKRHKQTAFVEMLRFIREEEPPKPSTRLSDSKDSLPSISAQRHMEPANLARLVRGELDWIVMKSLDKDRSRRYETASGFAADVQRYLNDETVQACPPTVGYRLRKFARRNKRPVVAGLALAALLLLGTVGTSIGLAWALQAEYTATLAAAAEAQAKDSLKQTLDDEMQDAYFRRITLAYRELLADNLGGALKLLELCPQELRKWEWHCLMRLCRVEPVVLRDTTEVNSIAFSAKGELLASAGGDGKIKVWNSETGKVIKTLENAHSGYACSVAFHHDGKHLASVGVDWQGKEVKPVKEVKVWDLTTGDQVFHAPCDSVHVSGTAYAVAFSPDGNQLAVGSDGDVMLWDWRNAQILHTFAGREKHRISVAFSRDGRLASGNWGGEHKALGHDGRGKGAAHLPRNKPPSRRRAGVQQGGRPPCHGQLRAPCGGVGYDDRRARIHASA